MIKFLERLLESFNQGERKAILEAQSKGAPCLSGTGSAEFDKWVEEVYAPYRNAEEKARKIIEPKGFLEKYFFRIGYKSISS